MNENDYLLKLNRRVIKLSRIVFFFFFQRGKISAVSTHDRKHQTHSQGSFPGFLLGPLTYAAVLCVLNASVHKTTYSYRSLRERLAIRCCVFWGMNFDQASCSKS